MNTVFKKPYIFRAGSASVKITEWGDGNATISDLHSLQPRLGHATELMNLVVRRAQIKGLNLLLDVQRFGDPHRGLSNDQLVEFYKKFGFIVCQDGVKPVMMIRYLKEEN